MWCSSPNALWVHYPPNRGTVVGAQGHAFKHGMVPPQSCEPEALYDMPATKPFSPQPQAQCIPTPSMLTCKCLPVRQRILQRSMLRSYSWQVSQLAEICVNERAQNTAQREKADWLKLPAS